MKKIFTALSALMICLLAGLPVALIAADDASEPQKTLTYEVGNGAKGVFVGGNAQVGTGVPRTWRNTDGLTIALTGITTNRQQQFALGAGNAFLMNGIFTVTAPEDAAFHAVEITVASTNTGSPSIKFPSSAQAVTTAPDGSEKTISYTFAEPVKSFDFEISGQHRMLVKKLKLVHSGTISTTITEEHTTVIDASTGKLSGKNSSAWQHIWTSNTEDPKVTINVVGGANNMGYENTGGLLGCAPGNARNSNYKIEAEGADYISKVKMAFKIKPSDQKDNPNITLTIDGKEFKLTNEDQTYEAEYKQGSSITFNLKGDNKSIVFTTFEVTTMTTKKLASKTTIFKVNSSSGALSGNGSSAWQHIWTSNRSTPQLTITTAKNNMGYDNTGGLLGCAPGNDKTSDYTVATDGKHYISHLKIGFKIKETDQPAAPSITLTINGQAFTVTDDEQTYESDYNHGNPVTFNLKGDNKSVVFPTFEVTVKEVEKGTIADATCSFSQATGSFTDNGNYHGEWLSNASSPQFSLTTGTKAKNMLFANGHIQCFTGSNNAGKTYTIAAGDEYYVSKVKMTVKLVEEGTNVTFTMAGQTITPTTAEQSYEFNFTEGTPAQFVMAGDNKGFEFVKLDVTATPNGQKPGQGGGQLSVGTEVSVNVNQANGTLYRDGQPAASATTFSGEWLSTSSNPQISVAAGAKKNNMIYANGHVIAYTGQEAVGQTYTISAGDTHYISHVKMVMKDYDSNGTVTLSIGGKDYTASATAQTIDVDFEEGTPATFKLDGQNKGIEFTNFVVTATPNGIEPGQATTPSTPTGSTITIDSNNYGMFAGGSDAQGTEMPRTWVGTVDGVEVTVTLKGTGTSGTEGKQQFAADGDTDAFLMNGSFTLSVPDNVKVSKAEFTMTATDNGTPRLNLPTGGNNYVTTTADGAEHTLPYTWAEPVSTFNFDTGGSKKSLSVKKIVLTLAGGSTVTPDPGPEPTPDPVLGEPFRIFRNQCQELQGSLPSTNYCQSLLSATTPSVKIQGGNDKNNIDRRTKEYFLLHSGGSELDYHFIAENGYFLTDLSFDYRIHGDNASTITVGGKTYTGTADDQHITVSGNNSDRISIRISEGNKGVELRNIYVTLVEDPYAEEEPAIPEKPGYIGGGNPVEFEVSPAPTGSRSSDGFHPDTKWYVLTLAENEYSLPYVEGADRITLSAAKSAKDEAQQYCITGNATDGYTLYNKAAGPGMVLASPKEMKGTTGMESYTILKAPGDPNYVYTWDMYSSSSLAGKPGYYIGQHGVAANKMNNRGNILAFWTGGADKGSTFLFYPPENVPQTAEYLKAPAIFPRTGEKPYNVCYRIPAIAVVGGGEHAGRIIAFSDYRKHGDGDISPNSNIDQHYTYSDDGGETWKHPDWMRDANGKPVSLARNGVSLIDPTDRRDNSFSDPCVAADRESGRIIVMSPAGTAGFFSGQYPENPTEVARWFSYDGGDTWTDADYDVTHQIHADLLKDAYDGDGIDGMFWGSGKIHQSRHVKVGKYWRLYHAISVRNSNVGGTKNYVFYSDDFGENWELLGHNVNDPAAPSNGDEPKTEEMPDGSVALIARGHGGNRNYNIFTFTNVEKGEGSWGTLVNRNLLGQGINACNGEPLMVPAYDTQTHVRCYILLQSVPWNGNRSDVSIVWKKIDKPADYASPTAIAENWTDRYRVSFMSSAYSTMAQMLDGNIAFIYEESTWGQTFTEMFRKLSLKQITKGRYDYIPDPDMEISKAIAAGLSGIENVEAETPAASPSDGPELFYDLYGRRVDASSLRPGQLYITSHGRKFIAR
ncbi:MAG: glycoside hydrolase [Alloprevotella sp.]|nr:glycoside hydrolase [Alloprevotella sp.]